MLISTIYTYIYIYYIFRGILTRTSRFSEGIATAVGEKAAVSSATKNKKWRGNDEVLTEDIDCTRHPGLRIREVFFVVVMR